MKTNSFINVLLVFVFLFSVILVNPVYARNNPPIPTDPPVQNGLMGPPWFNQNGEASGIPYWYANPQEGTGPWFWQVSEFGAMDIGPTWYPDYSETGIGPAWLFNDNITRPWWSAYILNANNLMENTGVISSQNGLMGPPWSNGTGETPGIPYWYANPQEGTGPWFWQVSEFGAMDIGPTWYPDYLDTGIGPAWLFNENITSPWWWSSFDL